LIFVPNLFCGLIFVPNLFCGLIFVPNLFCGLIFVPNLFCGFIFILRRPFSFQIYLADTGEGPFLRTGDLGFIQAGERFVTGVLNLRGMVGSLSVKSGFIIEFIVAKRSHPTKI